MPSNGPGVRAVLVTGGTRGIGRVIARRFVEAGAGVVVCGRNPPRDDEPDSDAPAFVAADLRDPEQAAGAVDFAVKRLGGLDVLINNAGGSPMADAATMSPRFFSSIVGLNLLAPFYAAQRANHHMQTQATGGHVINIGSVSGVTPAPGTAPYTAAKAGLRQLTRALALEWGPKVRVNHLTIGLVRTELAHLHYGDEDGLAAVAGTIPLGRMATPDDVASACLLLTSPLASYVSGADLAVDGGGERPARYVVANPTTEPNPPGPGMPRT